MMTLRSLITPVIIAMGLSLMSAQVFAEANFDSVLVLEPAAKFIDNQGWISWKATVVNMTSETAYYHIFAECLDTAGFELTKSGVMMESIKPYSLKSYTESFNLIARYWNQFGSVQISIEKDKFHTQTAPKSEAMTSDQKQKALADLAIALTNLGKK
jgi:hypothetical protein